MKKSICLLVSFLFAFLLSFILASCGSMIISNEIPSTDTVEQSNDPNQTTSPTNTPKPAFAIKATDAIALIDDYVFSDWFDYDEGDPRLSDHMEAVNTSFICTPTSIVTLTFRTDGNGNLTGLIFDHNTPAAVGGINYSYFKEYVAAALFVLYGKDSYFLTEELNLEWIPLGFTEQHTVEKDGAKWTLSNVANGGHLMFYGNAG